MNRLIGAAAAARRLTVLAVLAVLALLPLLVSTSAHAGVDPGDRAVELVNAKDGRGKRVKLRSYRKKVVVLTFGASWCKPCKKELPAWEALARKYKGKVAFLAFNIDRELDKGKTFVKEAGLRVMRAVYEPDGATVESYDPPTMPTTYVIDQRGIVRFRHAGYRAGDEKKLSKELDKLLR